MNKRLFKRYVLLILLGGVAVGILSKAVSLPLTIRLFTATFCIGAVIVLMLVSGLSGILHNDDH